MFFAKIVRIQPNVVEDQQPQPLVWGSHSLAELIINAMYDEIVHWLKNIFLPPLGKAGKLYICGTTRLLRCGQSSYS